MRRFIVTAEKYDGGTVLRRTELIRAKSALRASQFFTEEIAGTGWHVVVLEETDGAWWNVKE